MESEGDITEAFDDGELAKSIESGSKGPWNDESAVFVDPKLEQLKKEMLTPEQLDYKRRRLLELQKRAEQGEKKKAQKAAAKPAPAPTWSEETEEAWGGTVPVWNEHGTVGDSPWTERREAEQMPPAESLDSTIVNARRASDRVEPDAELESHSDEASTEAAAANGLVISYTPSILAAMVVFVAATMVHGTMVGWQAELIYRGSAAMLLTGILWRRFQGDRLRAVTIGSITYAIFFVSSDQLEHPENIFAVFLGLLIVIAGAGLIGVQRDEFGMRRL